MSPCEGTCRLAVYIVPRVALRSYPRVHLQHRPRSLFDIRHNMHLFASLSRFSFSFSAVSSFFAAPSHDAGSSTIVDLGYARYRGNHSNAHTVAYLGLPYAEPPIGNLRWRAPLPLNTTRIAQQSKGKVVDARSYPEFCVQGWTDCS